MKFIPKLTQNEDGVYPSRPEHPALRFFKIDPAAFDPQWGTEYAACFDLRACIPEGTSVKSFNRENVKVDLSSFKRFDNEQALIIVEPGHRVMVPTGLMFDIPVGYSIRLHSRSGLALKQALVLANHEGVVDSDYVDPTFIVLTNNSNVPAEIFHGDRIGQGEMMVDIAFEIQRQFEKPLQKTDRVGGFGSTGKT